MAGGIETKLADKIQLNLQLEDGDSTKFPLAILKDKNGDPIPANPVPIVLVKGLLETTTTHKDTLETISGLGRRVVAINDPRLEEVEPRDGHPKSQYNRSVALTDCLMEKGITLVDVIAHSEGAIPTIIAALNNPDRFRSIVFVDPVGLIDKHSSVLLGARYAGMLAKDAARMAKSPRKILNLLRAANEGGKSFASNPKRTLRDVTTIASADIYDMLDSLKDLGVNVSVIHGVNDSLFPMDKLIDKHHERQMAKGKGIATTGFYSVKGDHRELSVQPKKYAALAVNALENLSNKQ